MQLTTNTRAFIEAEQYSNFILMNLHDGLLPGDFYRNVSDFAHGETLNIKTLGSVTIQDAEENTPLTYSPIESGTITMQITKYKGDAWFITDDIREDGNQLEALVAARQVEQTRALQEVFETDFLAQCAAPYASATTGMPVNGFDHFYVSDKTNNVFDIEYFVRMRLAFDKANVPAAGRIFICDPIVEATLNMKITITNDVTQFAANILERGLAEGQRFISNWMGWDVLCSNRLYVGSANDGTTTLSGAVFNIFMCILDDQTKPVMAAWRRMPKVEGERNKDLARDEWVTRSRYGFGLQRIDTLGCVATSATNIT